MWEPCEALATNLQVMEDASPWCAAWSFAVGVNHTAPLIALLKNECTCITRFAESSCANGIEFKSVHTYLV